MDIKDERALGLTAAEHAQLKASLADLPDTMPPRTVWHRIERQAAAEGLLRPKQGAMRIRWAAGSGIAAAVVALALFGLPRNDFVAGDAANGIPRPATVGGQPPNVGLELRTIDALMTRSARLERDLRRLPTSPALTRASTAGTIDRLERQIAVIDQRLNDSPVRLTERQQELLWQERVRLMNSLLKLRYAQLQRGAF